MRVLITRPLEEAQALAALLTERGIASLIDPLLEIRLLPSVELSLEGVQALIFTSANGARAFAERESRRTLPVYAVGARTAEVARAAGFTEVESAEGALPDLARLVRARLDPRRGALLHGAGAVVKGELAELLAADGFTLRRVVLYEAVPATALQQATRAALAAGELDAVLFFSPRTAATFVSLALAAGLAGACARLRAISLSPAVAEEAGALAWRQSLTAVRPEQSALLACLGAERSEDPMSEGTGERPQETGSAAGESQVLRAIRAFGGIRPMAAKLAVPATTVQGWKERGHIPPARIADVLAAAALHGVPLGAADLAAPAAHEAALAPAAAAPRPLPASAATGPHIPPSPPGADEGSHSAPAASSTSHVERGLPRGLGLAAALWVLALAAILLAVAVSLPAWGPALGLKEREAAPPPPAASTTALAQQLGAVGKGLESIEGRLGSLEAQGKASASASRESAPVGDAAELAAKQSRLAEELAQSEARVTALERTLGELASRPQPTAGEAADSAAKLAAFSERLAALERGNAALGQESAAVQQRLAALETALQKAQAAEARGLALVLAIAELREALTRSLSYEKPLAAVAALAAGDGELEAAVATLKGAAATGVPTLGELSERFDAASLAAARAAILPDRPGWIGETLARLKHLVVIRHMGELAGSSPDALLSRAEVLLKAGDLAAAVAALGGLSAPAADAMKPWLEGAKARLAVDAAAAELSTRALARLGEP
ncbi:MAG TPA: uroporphyrinogen-III synthase [Alphaproteobacteria bacterium]|nr:uroporphyrinogen-III synthase [Alphaproteobacteria bacterium]